MARQEPAGRRSIRQVNSIALAPSRSPFARRHQSRLGPLVRAASGTPAPMRHLSRSAAPEVQAVAWLKWAFRLERWGQAASSTAARETECAGRGDAARWNTEVSSRFERRSARFAAYADAICKTLAGLRSGICSTTPSCRS